MLVFFYSLKCVLQVVGAVAFAIGVYGIVMGSDFDVITGDDVVSAAAILLVGGIVTFIVATIGVIGACAMWRPLLLIYAISVAVIVILEFVAAIIAFVFVDTITDEIRDNMEGAISDFRFNSSFEGYDSDVNNAIETVQETFECCGVDNATDWYTFNRPAFIANGGEPPFCDCDLSDDDNCRQYTVAGFSFTAWEDGCAQRLEDNLETVGIAIGVLSIIFAVIEVLLILMALGLCCCIYSAHRQGVV
jgi:hypothetical protein